MLSFFDRESGQRGHFIVYDIMRDQVVVAIELQPSGPAPNRCGRQAGNEDYQTDWTPDGATLILHTECGVMGENGIWMVDVATGARRLISAWKASFVDVAGDGKHLVFQAWGNSIWVADVDGSPPILLAEGWMPVWQPQPR
jgi:hypothetical protein